MRAEVNRFHGPVAVLVLAILAPVAAAQEAEDSAEPALAEAVRGPFTVILELDGSFEPVESAEVAFRPRAYEGVLEVVQAAPTGPVEAGSVLVRFDTRAIDEEIANLEREVSLSRANLAKQKEAASRKEEEGRIALATAEAAARHAQEGLSLFDEVERPLRIKESEFEIEGTGISIENQEEELAQLEKMYTADDLTEETEEIVLKRARRQLERTRAYLDFEKIRHETLVGVTLPAEREDLVLARDGAAREFDLAKATGQADLEVARVELDQAVLAHETKERKLADLKKDREETELRAPVPGIAVPGSFAHGKWSEVAGTRDLLVPGGRVDARTTLYTLFRAGALRVLASAEEAAAWKLQEGQSAEVRPTAGEGLALAGKVARILPAWEENKFSVTIEMEKGDERLLPGETCKARVVIAQKPDAITVPEGAVVKKGERSLVEVWKDGKAAPRDVKAGATSDGRTEILEGLEAGERVVESPSAEE